MTRRKTRNYSSDHCQCCIICCAPALGLTIFFENLLKCICCCPCYIDNCYEKKENKIKPITPTIPNDIAIPIDGDVSDRYYGKIWGINN